MTRTVDTARAPHFTHSALALALLLVAACRGADEAGVVGEDEPLPVDTTGGQSGDPGNGGPIDCSGQRWDGPESEWISASCAPIGEDRWECRCIEQDPAGEYRYFGTGEAAVAVDADGCAAALKAGCDVDAEAPGFCSTVGLGTCWPGASDAWSCECGAGVQVIHQESQTCTDTLWAECGDRCETPFGSCGEVADTQYRCQCAGVEGPLPPDEPPPRTNPDGTVTGSVVSNGPQTCAEAMEQHCGERCASSAGRCEPEADGFECSCDSGAEGHVTFESLGGISPSACTAALQGTCGAELHAPMTTCTEPIGGSVARCEASPRVWEPGEPRPEGFEYRCTCSEGEGTVVVEATACYRAMLAACGDVIGEAPGQPARAGELGALCTAASDCSAGLCHLGRLGRDGTCTAPCETDQDCPSEALCSWSAGADVGHCFVACDSNAGGYFACERLNAASDDPLNCLDRVDLDYANLSEATGESGQICAPLSDQYWPLPVRR